MMLNMILNIVYGMVITGLILYVLYKVMNVSIEMKRKVVFLVVYGVVLWGCSFINIAIRQIILAIIFIELAHRYLKVQYYKAIMGGVLGLIFVATGDIFASVILHSIAGIPEGVIRNNPIILTLLYLIVSCAVIVITSVYKKLNGLIGISDDLNMKNSIVSMVYILIIMIFEGVLGEILKLIPSGISKIYMISFFVLMIMFAAINFAVLYINNKYITQKNEYDQLKIYTGIVEDLVSDVRKFRHDYVNIISSIDGYIENEDVSGLKSYFHNEIIKESKGLHDNNNMLKLQNIKNPAIKGLVSTKIVQAENVGINLNVEIANEINDIAVKTIDMCKILGVLIDNGIEASVESEKKIMNIGMMEDGEKLIFLIANTYKSIPKISDMFKEGFSTKGENRGIGLSVVKGLIDNNYKNILLNTFIENSFFKHEIIITKSK